MTTDWLLRIGDGENFKRSSKYKIWGIESNIATNKHFLKNIKKDDRLWFVKSKSNGKIIAVATYCSHNKREFGPLIDISLTNEELGWVGSGIKWTADTEIHYSNLYGLENCNLFSQIKGPATIRRYNKKCNIDLETEYKYILKYSKIIFKLI